MNIPTSDSIKKVYEYIARRDFSYTTDSRKVVEGDLFIAIVGEIHDGNNFVSQALANGARYIVTHLNEESIASKNTLSEDVEIITVSDTRAWYRELAQYHRQQFDIPVIAIAGSNGKSTTKNLAGNIIAISHTPLITPENDNNEIGVAQTLLQLRDRHTHAILEVGTNHPGELKDIVEMVAPTHGVITNIGKEHLEFFGSIKGVLEEELELYRYFEKTPGTIYVPDNEELLKDNVPNSQKSITYGEDASSDVYLTIDESTSSETLSILYKNTSISLQLFGAYNLYNAAAAIAITQTLGVDMDDISQGLSSYNPDGARSNIVATPAGNTVIFDCYNANPDSMKMSLEAFNNFQTDKGKVIILGDMLEMGESAPKEHQAIIDFINQEKITSSENTYIVGNEFSGTTDHNFNIYQDKQEFAELLKSKPFANTCILIKASRGIFYGDGIHKLLVY